MSWNILCSLLVYSKPHACCEGEGKEEEEEEEEGEEEEDNGKDSRIL